MVAVVSQLRVATLVAFLAEVPFFLVLRLATTPVVFESGANRSADLWWQGLELYMQACVASIWLAPDVARCVLFQVFALMRNKTYVSVKCPPLYNKVVTAWTSVSSELPIS